MSEIVFDRLQLGPQTGTPGSPGAAVAATSVFPIDAGLIDPDLDRGYASPDEDYGSLSRHQTNRASYGLRSAGVPFTAVLRFEDAMRLLEMRLAGGITPTGVGPYTWTYTMDDASDTCKVYTAEVGSETANDEYKLSTCLITDLELGYDALVAPGEHPWKATATLVAIDRTQAALTAALTAPSAMETIEGHLTTLYEGTTATAFASLAELAASLVGYKLKISGARPYRAYGSATDLPTAYGLAKPELTIEAMVKVGATSKTNIFDIFMGAGAPAGERRWRVKATGSGTKVLTLDHRVRFTSVRRSERDGESVYLVAADVVKDATLSSSLQAIVINSVAGPLT